VYFMSAKCERPQGEGGWPHVDRGKEGGQNLDFLVEIINAEE